MATIFIFHGSYGSPNENWFPWLKEKLEADGHIVYVPQFPTPENQNLTAWLQIFNKYRQYITKDTIFIGHSIGCAFILNILETLDQPIKASFLVAGFLKKLNRSEFIKLNKTFVDKEFDWQKIKNNCIQFLVFNADDDPYVPIEKGIELAEKLGVAMITVQHACHFNEKAGYTKFELLLVKVKEIIG